MGTITRGQVMNINAAADDGHTCMIFSVRFLSIVIAPRKPTSGPDDSVNRRYFLNETTFYDLGRPNEELRSLCSMMDSRGLEALPIRMRWQNQRCWPLRIHLSKWRLIRVSCKGSRSVLCAVKVGRSAPYLARLERGAGEEPAGVCMRPRWSSGRRLLREPETAGPGAHCGELERNEGGKSRENVRSLRRSRAKEKQETRVEGKEKEKDEGGGFLCLIPNEERWLYS